ILILCNILKIVVALSHPSSYIRSHDWTKGGGRDARDSGDLGDDDPGEDGPVREGGQTDDPGAVRGGDRPRVAGEVARLPRSGVQDRAGPRSKEERSRPSRRERDVVGGEEAPGHPRAREGSELLLI